MISGSSKSVLRLIIKGEILTKALLRNNRKTLTKLGVSFIILTTISIQVYSAILRIACDFAAIPLLCALPDEPRLYPFLDYPMYSVARKEGVSVNQYKLIAIFDDGAEKQLGAEDFQLSKYWFTVGVLAAFRNNNHQKIKQYVEAYERTGNRPFVALRFDNQPLAISREGVLEGTPEVGETIPTISIKE